MDTIPSPCISAQVANFVILYSNLIGKSEIIQLHVLDEA